MAATVTFRLANGKEVQQLLGKIVDRVKNPLPVYTWIGDNVLLPALRGQFKTEGARGGTPWVPYTQAEKASGYVGYKKAETGSERPILDWNGPFRRMVPSFINRSHPDHIYSVSNKGVVEGSKVPWAENHDKGTGLGWHGEYTIPQRPIAVLTTRVDIAACVEAFEEYIVNGKILRGPVA